MIMLKHIYKSILMLLALFIFSTAGVSAAECKDSGKSSCSANSNCTWVSGYRKQDDASVKGYCRSNGKSNSKSSDKKANGKKSSTKSDVDSNDSKKAKKEKIQKR